MEHGVLMWQKASVSGRDPWPIYSDLNDYLYFWAGTPPLIDANGDGIGKYNIYQLNDLGFYQKVGKWIAGKKLDLDVERVRLIIRLERKFLLHFYT